MAITTLAYVKILADLYTRAETGAPTTASVGAVGDIWLDNSSTSATYGKTYECTAINDGPPVTYTWTLLTRDDAKIEIAIDRAEKDYLSIRGIDFETADDGVSPDYPDGADYTAAEMVCYLNSYGTYQGRGEKSESMGDRNAAHDDKLRGYPLSIVGTIERFQRAQ